MVRCGRLGQVQQRAQLSDQSDLSVSPFALDPLQVGREVEKKPEIPAARFLSNVLSLLSVIQSQI